MPHSLDLLLKLKPFICDDLKESLLVKMIDETEVLDCAIASHLEGGHYPAPTATVEKFMAWVFTDCLPSLLDLETDMTPSAEVVAKLKPAFSVWLTKFNAFLDEDSDAE
jgi:hypothetical protein